MATTLYQIGYKSCTRTREDAERLLAERRQGILIEEVSIDADPVYNGRDSTHGFSLWSDGRIRDLVIVIPTPATIENFRHAGDTHHYLSEVAERIEGLGTEAIALLHDVYGSDSARPEWLPRLRQAAIVRRTRSEAKAGSYAGPELTDWRLTLDDGSVLTLTSLTEGYSEGYICEFFGSHAAALRYLGRRGWVALHCLECGADYDVPGHVEPGQMGCDRCNA